MVTVTRKRVKGNHALRRSNRKAFDKETIVASALALGATCYVLWCVLGNGSSSSDTLGSTTSSSSDSQSASNLLLRSNQLGKKRPDLHVEDPNTEYYNAIAIDIIQTLDCPTILNQTFDQEYGGMAGVMDDGLTWQQREQIENGIDGIDGADVGGGDPGGDAEQQRRMRRRRLQEVDGAGGAGGFDPDAAEDAGGWSEGEEGDVGMDPYGGGGGGWAGLPQVTGQTLFCLAAYPSSDPTYTARWKDSVVCDATAGTKQRALLDLWSMARVEMSETILKQALETVIEHQQREFVAGHRLPSLWAPSQDDGLEWMMSILTDAEKNVDHGGIHGLEENLGKGKLFVDVGSCLGLTSMAIAMQYPGTKIVSIEPAAPNWLFQEMNWRCNADEFGAEGVDKTVILSGVGPSDKGHMEQMAKFMWKPAATTATRAWTPASEKIDGTDIEITVKLRPFHTVLAEAAILPTTSIDVLNVDCEGCEYNFIPALSQKQFASMKTVMGGIHWGYIPRNKLPSSARAKTTHERLCWHENFARIAKECCAFPDLTVRSSVAGEALVREESKGINTPATVQDVAGELCDGFAQWAKEHYLNDITTDFGWFQLTSMAE